MSVCLLCSLCVTYVAAHCDKLLTFRGVLLGVCLIVYDLETSSKSRTRPDVSYCTTEKIL